MGRRESVKKTSLDDLSLLELERSLRKRLSPVKPDQQFVGTLRQRLEDSPAYRHQRRLAVSMLSIAAGLVVGLAIFLIGRSFIHSPNKV